jgi:hypothetical protein
MLREKARQIEPHSIHFDCSVKHAIGRSTMARKWMALAGCGIMALATAFGGESLATKHFEHADCADWGQPRNRT